LRISTFLAYPFLFPRVSTSCQNQLNAYNSYIQRSRDATANQRQPSQTTRNGLAELTSLENLSSQIENDFLGYETCRDNLSQVYYVAHQQSQLNDVHYGICSPTECSAQDISNLIEGLKDVLQAYPSQRTGVTSLSTQYFELLHLNLETRVYNPELENENARTIRFWNVVFWGIIIQGALMLIIGSIYHLYLRANGFEEYEIFAHRDPNLWHREEGSFLQRLVLGFSFIKTWEKLCDTRSRLRGNALIILRGYKVFFVVWIAFGSYMYYSVFVHKPIEQIEDNYSHQIWYSLSKSLYTLIDCLLWCSGVHTAYIFLSELQNRVERPNESLIQKAQPYVVEIVYKIIRLWPIVLITMLMYGW
jgi:hypothetical protein